MAEIKTDMTEPKQSTEKATAIRPTVHKISGTRLRICDMPYLPLSCLPRQCKLGEMLQGYKRLSIHGDRRDEAAYKRKRAAGEEVENRKVRLAMSYTTRLIERLDNPRLVDIVIDWLPSSAIDAKCRDDPKGNFRKMTGKEIAVYVNQLCDTMVGELQAQIDQIYDKAWNDGVQPEYYGFAVV